MANAERGEVDLVIGDRNLVLRLTWNEIAKFETVQDLVWFEDFAPKLLSPSRISGGQWIALLWAALQDRQAGITLVEAGDLLTKVGIEVAVEHLTRCLRFTFPDPENAAENPR